MTASDRLYAAIMALRERLEPLPNTAAVRRALGGLALGVATGRYSDFRSVHPDQGGKAGLVTALLDNAPDAIVDDMSALCADIETGAYADEPVVESESVQHDMTAADRRVFVWVYRYIEVYGQSPTAEEIAVSLGLGLIPTNHALKALVASGALRKESGRRCWVPTRIP